MYGTSGSGKTSFLKYYLDQTKNDFIVFGRDEAEFPGRFIQLLQLENITIESLAAKDVLPVVRENCFKLYITINNPDTFFETMMSCYSIKQLNWKQYRDQLEFGVIEFDTRSQKYKILNQKYQLIYDTSKHKWGPEDYVKYESCFFTGEE